MRSVAPVVAAAAALVIAGCSSGSPAGSGQASSPPASASASASAGGLTAAPAHLRWHPCTVQGAQLQCASLQVPLNYARPNGRKITLALSEVPATAPPDKRQGVLLVNPGGPGGPGLYLAAVVAAGLQPSVASEYTIVGFDTRGTGASVPSLHCDPAFFNGPRPNYIPASQAAERVLIDRAKAYAADCERKYGWLLPYMTTEDFARDLDSIRAALGQQKINYFAYSYGTYLGEVYATMFPGRVRRMVLDSVVDPNGAWWTDNIKQDYAFENRLKAFFAWVARYDQVYRLGSTEAQVSQAWYKARGELLAHPVADTIGTKIGPDEFDDTFLTGGYSDSFWPGLAAALASYLRSGSAAQLVRQYQAEGIQSENEFAVYNAVECSDAAWPRSWAVWNRATRTVYARAPFLAWDNAWFNAACAFWPVKAPAHPLAISGAGLPPILILQGTLDAATPYAGALVAHRLLPSSKMVVVEGGGNHGQSLSDPPNTCVNGYLNRYLATGAVPSGPDPVNATCPALPPPTPAG